MTSKPADSAYEFLKAAIAECRENEQAFSEQLHKAGFGGKMLWGGLTRAAELKFRGKVATARDHWGNLEVDKALKDLKESNPYKQ
jgi:hypothetical protein